ncbi:hypothetical protein RE476_05365 [Methanolobus mangrovi]|uniref:Uncharacterized protein n=1 Tax=Methanolobus mangrovi TaxID=3072977 RepID=A0AA51UI20_9EURY|nr:hypothetical protein [Methanolobus mangrovi]WMW23259.1 hypothetical protein RE476_05365 [Methanolobus mangrovi]
MDEDINELGKRATRLGYELMALEDELDIIIEGIENTTNVDEKVELIRQKGRIECEIADIKDERYKLNERLLNSF